MFAGSFFFLKLVLSWTRRRQRRGGGVAGRRGGPVAGSKGSRSPLVLLQAAHVNYNPSAQTVQDRTLEPVTTYASRTTSDRRGGGSRAVRTLVYTPKTPGANVIVRVVVLKWRHESYFNEYFAGRRSNIDPCKTWWNVRTPPALGAGSVARPAVMKSNHSFELCI